MRAPYTQIYVHLVWATWDRLPLITGEMQGPLYAAMIAKCTELHCEPIAVGGIADHVHLLARLSPAVSVAQLVKEVKGSTSHLVTHVLKPGEFFKWQGAYGAFTIRKSEVATVKRYVANQASQHAENLLTDEFESVESLN